MCLSFFFNGTATTEIYTLSLHDALPISGRRLARAQLAVDVEQGLVLPGGVVLLERGAHRLDVAELLQDLRLGPAEGLEQDGQDRKSTRLNSSHANISYAVFCLKKKKT